MQANDFDSQFSAGLEHLEQGHPELAVDCFERAIDLDPNVSQAFYNRALCYEVIGNFALALADFSQTAELDPNDTDAYLGKANCHYELGNFHAALVELERADELDKTSDVEGLRGLTYFALGENEQAIGDFTRALERHPEKRIIHFNRAHAYANLRDFDAAVADYSASLGDGYDAEVLYHRGVANTERGQFRPALDDFKAALALGDTSDELAAGIKHLESLIGPTDR